MKKRNDTIQGKQNKTRLLTQTGILMALVFVITRFIQIPIPLGYFNVGNSIIMLGSLLLPMPYGVLAASVGSALADLTSFPIYTIPTLIIKAVFPVVFYMICKKNNTGKRQILAAIISTLIPLFGYTLVGALISGTLMTGLAQFPGLLVEYAANLVIFGLLHRQMAKLKKILYTE